jgi:hypothetical protein
MAMNMLHNRRSTRRADTVNDITKILELCIQWGLNLNYLNLDNRNISDYCIQNGFINTPVERLLANHNAPAPTGNVYAGHRFNSKRDPDDPDIYEKNEIARLLKEYRFLKDQEKLGLFYKLFQTLTIKDLPPNSRGNYDDFLITYVSRYGWYCTPVEEHINLLQKEAKKLSSVPSSKTSGRNLPGDPEEPKIQKTQ